MEKKLKIPLSLFLKMKLKKKYNKSINYYNIKKINELVFEKTSDYNITYNDNLLFGNEKEFLRRFYKMTEIKNKLRKLFSNFQKKYRKIFPNYFLISERKILYKYIKSKKRLIYKLKKLKRFEKENKENILNFNNNTIFTDEVLNSILNKSESNDKNDLENIINISNDNTIDEIKKLIYKIEKSENKNKSPVVSVNHFNENIQGINSINYQKDQISKKSRNSQVNSIKNLLTESGKSCKKLRIKNEIFPMINVSKSKFVIHQTLNDENIKGNIRFKKKSYRLDNNYDIRNEINKNALQKKNENYLLNKNDINTKLKDNFSISLYQRSLIKCNSENEDYKKYITLSDSSKKEIFPKNLKKNHTKKLIPLKIEHVNHNNFNYFNDILTENSNMNTLKLKQNNIKLKRLFSQN